MSEMVRERTVTELVRAAADGDGRAWGEIVVRYGDLVRATVAGFRLQQADAADAVQNTWLRALERIGTVREPERLGGWLTTTAARECLAVLRRSKRELPVDTFVDQVAWTGPTPETRVLHAERDRAVDAAVAQLPTRRRELVNAIFGAPTPTTSRSPGRRACRSAASARPAGAPSSSCGAACGVTATAPRTWCA